MLSAGCAQELCALSLALVSAHSGHGPAVMAAALAHFVPADAADMPAGLRVRLDPLTLRRLATRNLADVVALVPTLRLPAAQVPPFPGFFNTFILGRAHPAPLVSFPAGAAAGAAAQAAGAGAAGGLFRRAAAAVRAGRRLYRAGAGASH